MKKSTVILLILLAFLFLKCTIDPETTSREAANDAVQAETPNSAATPKMPAGNFIRTADLKFKVTDVVKATHHIEDAVAKHGGYVAYTNLSSEVHKVESTKISSDSLLEITTYTPTNSMIIRIPNATLDALLREITSNADFCDLRVIKAEDATIRLLNEQLTWKRTEKSNTRIEKDVEKLKNTRVPGAEEVLLKNQEIADRTTISELTMKDLVNFSAVNLDIYQKLTRRKEIFLNADNTEAFEQSFGRQLATALGNGWYQVKKSVIFLANLWVVFLLGTCIYLFFKKYSSRVKL